MTYGGLPLFPEMPNLGIPGKSGRSVLGHPYARCDIGREKELRIALAQGIDYRFSKLVGGV